MTTEPPGNPGTGCQVKIGGDTLEWEKKDCISVVVSGVNPVRNVWTRAQWAKMSASSRVATGVQLLQPRQGRKVKIWFHKEKFGLSENQALSDCAGSS